MRSIISDVFLTFLTYECSGMKLSIDAQTHSSMLEMWKSAMPHRSPQVGKQSKTFLRSHSPPIDIPNLVSPPLFPRDRRPGHLSTSRTDNGKNFLESIGDLVPLLPPASIDQECEDDLYKEHMAVIDGWREFLMLNLILRGWTSIHFTVEAYEVPSSPVSGGTPSLIHGTSESDNLFFPPSPDNEPFATCLSHALMGKVSRIGDERY